MQAKIKIIAFVDILGLTNLVEASEPSGGDFSRAIELTTALGSATDSNKFLSHGPTTCPTSVYIERHLDFQVTQISDCVVASAELSPAGAINLLNYCFGISIRLLSKGTLCRGYVTIGNIHHAAGQFFGTGYMRALNQEKEVSFLRLDPDEGATPFIEIDESVVTYVRDKTDQCVRMLFGRMTRSDGGYTAIYPFKALAKSPGSVVTAQFDFELFREKIRRSIGYREGNLQTLQVAEDAAPTPQSKAKVRHYMRGVQEVLVTLRKKEALVEDIIAGRRFPPHVIA